MATVSPGRDLRVTLPPGATMTLTPDVNASGAAYRIGSKRIAMNFQASTPKSLGPFPQPREYSIISNGGSVDVAIVTPDKHFSALLANVEGFTGNLTLNEDDAGKIFRCDDASGVTVTIPASLPLGFICGVSRYGAGAVTFAAGAGMTSRSTATSIAAQYGGAEISVLKAGEYLIRGDVA